MDPSTWKKTYLAIDLKSFYASVECVERALDPLTTNLVVADQSRTEKTICLAVSPSLKAYGLSGRSRLFEVLQKAKEVKRQTGKDLEYIVAVPRMALYIKYSSLVYSIYLKYFSSDDIHIYSIDEVFIDATPYLKLYKTDAESLCRKVIQDVLNTTGITATAGIAPNLYLCKIAMDIVAKHIPADKYGVRIAMLDEMEYRKKLWNHKPITDFWRIGPGIQNRLAKNVLFTQGDIARRSLLPDGLNLLYKTFGIDAEILVDHAWGYEPCTIKDIKNYRSSTSSLSSGQVLSKPYSFEAGRTIVKEMAEMLTLEMVTKKLCSQSFTLYISYDSYGSENYDGEWEVNYYGKLIPRGICKSINLGTPTNVAAKIIDGVVSIYDQWVNRELYVRRLNISANNTVAENAVQLGLFDSLSSDRKQKDIQKAVTEIHSRFGKNAMLKGFDLEKDATTIERNQQIGGHKA